MAKTLHGDRMGGAAGFKMNVPLAVLASGATNTAQEKITFVAGEDMVLRAAYLMFIAALTGAATNHQKISIVNKGTDGAGTVEMAALVFSSTAVVAAAGVPLAMTLSATAANLLLAAGEMVSIKVAQAGSGQTYDISYPSAHFSLQ